MADYTIVTQYPDVEVIGGTQTQDVQRVGAVTNEHGVYFETTLARADATTANIKAQVNGYTIVYEMLFDIPGVADVQWTQEPTPAGLLADHFIVYVESTSGNSSAPLDFPLVHLNQDYVAPRVAKLRASLDATEAA